MSEENKTQNIYQPTDKERQIIEIIGKLNYMAKKAILVYMIILAEGDEEQIEAFEEHQAAFIEGDMSMDVFMGRIARLWSEAMDIPMVSSRWPYFK